MKLFFLISSVIFLSFQAHSQIGLKGYNIGDLTEEGGEELWFNIKTTINGLKGKLQVYVTNDKREIHTISYRPEINGKIYGITRDRALMFKNDVAEHFKIEYEPTSKILGIYGDYEATIAHKGYNTKLIVSLWNLCEPDNVDCSRRKVGVTLYLECEEIVDKYWERKKEKDRNDF